MDGNGCFTKHQFKTVWLGFQVAVVFFLFFLFCLVFSSFGARTEEFFELYIKTKHHVAMLFEEKSVQYGAQNIFEAQTNMLHG